MAKVTTQNESWISHSNRKGRWTMKINLSRVVYLSLAVLISMPVLAACMNPTELEAKQQAQQYADEYLLKCGELYYTSGKVWDGSLWFTEYRGLSFKAEPREEKLTAAEKANGYQWIGKVIADCTMWRHWNGRWSEWQGESWAPGGFRCELVKRHGYWTFIPDAFGRRCTWDLQPEKLSFTCADIP